MTDNSISEYEPYKDNENPKLGEHDNGIDPLNISLVSNKDKQVEFDRFASAQIRINNENGITNGVVCGHKLGCDGSFIGVWNSIPMLDFSEYVVFEDRNVETYLAN